MTNAIESESEVRRWPFGEVIARELREEFPLLWERAEQFDFAERLGGCTDPLLREIDEAMRELWDARRHLRAIESAG